MAWRGLGDLPQFTWAKPLVGSWLVIDLWAGFSGLCVALLAMGVRFHAVAAENDIFPAQVAEQIMPQVVAVDAVETVTGTMFRPFLQRRQVRGIILGGGSPCQGNSILNTGRKGLADTRSQQPQELVRIRQELQDLPECATLEIVTFLENVASMPREVMDQYTAWMGFPTYPHRCGRLRMGATAPAAVVRPGSLRGVSSLHWDRSPRAALEGTQANPSQGSF